MNVALSFTKLAQSVTTRCEKRPCINNATYEMIWNKGHGRKLLCTTHKKQLEKQLAQLLRTWFQLGPEQSTQI